MIEAKNQGAWRGSDWRALRWGAAALVLLVPLVAMQFSDEVRWDGADFAFAGVLIGGTGLVYELVANKARSSAYRAATAIALAAAFLLIWVNAAVGIIGSENNDANTMYAGVLGVGLVGALIARFRPHGMARAMTATALAQTLVAVVALVTGLGTDGPSWPRDILGCTGLFSALWLASAWLFNRAARGGSRLS